MICVLLMRNRYFDLTRMKLHNPFKIKFLSFLTVGLLVNNATTIWILLTSNTYDFYNPIELKWLFIVTDLTQTIYYMTLLVFIHATTRFPLQEDLGTRFWVIFTQDTFFTVVQNSSVKLTMGTNQSKRNNTTTGQRTTRRTTLV